MTLPKLKPGIWPQEFRLWPAQPGPSAVKDFHRRLLDLDAWNNVHIGLNLAQGISHGTSYTMGWWHDGTTGEPLNQNYQVPIKLALIHSEISEALEADRKGLMDDKLPCRPGIEVELADALHRIFDLAGALGLDLAGAYVDKCAYNAGRSDHKVENRAKAGGKAY